MANWYAQQSSTPVNWDAWGDGVSTVWFDAPTGGNAMTGTSWTDVAADHENDIFFASNDEETTDRVIINTNITIGGLRLGLISGFGCSATGAIVIDCGEGGLEPAVPEDFYYTEEDEGGLRITGSVNVTFRGYAIGGAQTDSLNTAIYTTSTGILTIIGNLDFGRGTCVYLASTTTLNITGNIKGGTACPSIVQASTGTITINNGTIESNIYPGIFATNPILPYKLILNNCNVINTVSAMAFTGLTQLTNNPTPTNFIRVPSTTGTLDYPIQVPANQMLSTFTSGEITGNITLPTESKVLAGTSFGANSTQYTGNVVLPATNKVAKGTYYGPDGGTIQGSLALDETEIEGTTRGR